VFISACKSQEFGEMFEDFCDHVICCKSNQSLDDDTAREFTVLFYEKVFNENQKICDAFNNALNIIKNTRLPVYANNFTLLKKEHHTCSRLFQYKEGSPT